MNPPPSTAEASPSQINRRPGVTPPSRRGGSGRRLDDVIVNCTAVGLTSDDDVFKALPMRADTFVAGSHVVDMVYSSEDTAFLAAARSREAEVIDGLEILVAQGAASFERWTGRIAPRGVMRSAVRDEPTT